jgi:ATP-dependent Zn protease
MNLRNHKTRAFHEAGHAVAARLLGVEIAEAVVRFRPNPYFHVQTRSAGDRASGTPGFRKGLEADIQVALAGHIAQKIHRPQSYREYQAVDDMQNAGQAAIRHCLEPGNGEDGKSFRFEGELPPEAADLVSRLHKPTVKLITENWSKVERVAAALLAHGELTQAEIDTAMAES